MQVGRVEVCEDVPELSLGGGVNSWQRLRHTANLLSSAAWLDLAFREVTSI